MIARVMWRCARAAVVELDDGGLFLTDEPWEVFVNGVPAGTTNLVETYFEGLIPGQRNVVRLVSGDHEVSVGITTPEESFTVNVRDCGAKGDGVHDDTTNIQAAIMACPEHGRVLVPEGTYLVKSLFLKSGISIELAEGCQILARHDREALAYLPGTLEGAPGAGHAGTNLLPLGRWEGESFSTYCSLFTGIGVHDVTIYGKGAIDGQTDFSEDNWWHNFKDIYRPEEGRKIARPRMIFLSECQRVSLAGITVRNSPSWNIHPILCDGVDALCLSIEGPKNSHNTDGFDPESCTNVRVLGCQFSVGDDCIAIKSGKLEMDEALRPPTRDMVVSHCYMHDGHGAVVLGSEAAGGIKDLTVSKCVFERTDRGLRIKTRRGRGEQAVNEGITFEQIRMDEVLTPFVVNSFYYCDPDGTSEYVQCREALPVDERTPGYGTFTFRDIEATNCHACAAFITGLPERQIPRVEFERVRVGFSPEARASEPAMACGVGEMARQGIIAQNVSTLALFDVEVEGYEGEELQLQNVGRVVRA